MTTYRTPTYRTLGDGRIYNPETQRVFWCPDCGEYQRVEREEAQATFAYLACPQCGCECDTPEEEEG